MANRRKFILEAHSETAHRSDCMEHVYEDFQDELRGNRAYEMFALASVNDPITPGAFGAGLPGW